MTSTAINHPPAIEAFNLTKVYGSGNTEVVAMRDVPFLNAVENVQIAMEINDVAPGTARKRALELLDYLGVADRANNLPDALSGGQQQRVAVARALANHPSLLLADEPTAALDSQRGRQVMELFRTVAHDRGAAVLVVTHDQRALDVFDRHFEMEDGLLRVGTDDA